LSQAGRLPRRFVLLLPLALAGCGGEDQSAFEPLRYNYLPPIQLNVASIRTEQRFVPSGVPPDVSNEDPAPPVDALKAMANDRLQAFGTTNKAIFAILDASLTRTDDVVIGSFAVSLTIQDDNGSQLGFAEARVESRHTGPLDHIHTVLYDMTKGMMSDMNVEFEYQIRHNLRDWLTNTVVPETPVEQAPLTTPGQQPLPPPAQPLTPPAQPLAPPSQPFAPPAQLAPPAQPLTPPAQPLAPPGQPMAQ
jgi:hypothetical protein